MIAMVVVVIMMLMIRPFDTNKGMNECRARISRARANQTINQPVNIEKRKLLLLFNIYLPASRQPTATRVEFSRLSFIRPSFSASPPHADHYSLSAPSYSHLFVPTIKTAFLPSSGSLRLSPDASVLNAWY